jgi:hypothetical protein
LHIQEAIPEKDESSPPFHFLQYHETETE